MMPIRSGESPASAVCPVQPERHLFEDDGAIPNSRLPFLVYSGVLELSGRDPAAVCEAVFAANQWNRSWRNGIYPFPHYHSTAHEVLGICRGEARVRFGGERGVVLTVRAGDVVVIPAGGGHQNLGASGDFLVVGAYPPGPRWDLCFGKAEERPRVLDNIAAVPLPPADPLFGEDGPLTLHWRPA
jgi:uncharacterized protein YjlB